MRISVDPDTSVVEERFAVVYAPARNRAGRTRDRFPDNCVTVMESEPAARAAADPSAGRYPAVVVGPSRSSEGLRLYYLVHWLEEA